MLPLRLASTACKCPASLRVFSLSPHGQEVTLILNIIVDSILNGCTNEIRQHELYRSKLTTILDTILNLEDYFSFRTLVRFIGRKQFLRHYLSCPTCERINSSELSSYTTLHSHRMGYMGRDD